MCSNSPSSSLTQKLFVIHHQNDLDSLWMHITTSNIHYTFTVLKDKEGTYHIAANPDRTMTPRLKRVEGAPSLAFQNEVIYRRQGDVFCQKISTKGVVFKAYKPEPSLEESLAAKTGTIAPIRDYFHPIGFSRITIGEWMLLETIVSPSDDAWQLRIANSVSLVRTLANAMTIILIQSHMLDKQMLDDFNDVSDEEKRFIKLWNAFVRSSPIHINNKDLRNQCMVFVGLHASVIGDYEEHLICHLITYVVWNSLNKKKENRVVCGLQITDNPSLLKQIVFAILFSRLFGMQKNSRSPLLICCFTTTRCSLWEEHQLSREDILVIMKHYGEVIHASCATAKDMPHANDCG